MNKKSELIKNTVIIFIGRFFTQFISFLLLPLYTSYINTSDYGTWDLLLTYITLLIPILSLQLDSAVFRFLIGAEEKEKKQVISNCFFTIFFNILIACSIFLFIGIIFNISNYIYIILMFVMCTISNFILQIARGLGKNSKYSIATVISGIINILSNVILIIFFNLGIKGLFISQIISNFFCILYLIITLNIYNYIDIYAINKAKLRTLLKYSFPLIPNGISWWIISVSDRTIISIFLNVSANGIYAISNKLSTIINTFLSIFNLAWTESASKYINSNDIDKYYTDICNDIISFFSFLTMLILTFLPLIFDFIISDSYNEAYLYIPILIIAALFNAIVQIYSGIYTAKKMTKQIAITSFIAAIINIIINLFFINSIGLYAAAISTLVAYFSIMLYRYIDIKKYVNIKYNYKNILIFTVLIALCTIIYYLNNKVLCGISFIAILLFAWSVWKSKIKSIFYVFYNKALLKKEYIYENKFNIKK